MAIRKLTTTVGFVCAGQYAAVVQHFITDDSTAKHPFLLAKELGEAMVTPSAGTGYIPAIANILSADSFISSVKTREFGVGNAPSYVKLFPSDAFPGDFAGNLDANQVSGCIIWLTEEEAGLNGRSFYPGVSEEALENGRFVDAYKDATETIGTALFPQIAGADNEFHIALKHDSPAQFTAIIHGYLSATPGTQRRRLVPY